MSDPRDGLDQGTPDGLTPRHAIAALVIIGLAVGGYELVAWAVRWVRQ